MRHSEVICANFYKIRRVKGWRNDCKDNNDNLCIDRNDIDKGSTNDINQRICVWLYMIMNLASWEAQNFLFATGILRGSKVSLRNSTSQPQDSSELSEFIMTGKSVSLNPPWAINAARASLYLCIKFISSCQICSSASTALFRFCLSSCFLCHHFFATLFRTVKSDGGMAPRESWAGSC